MHNSKPKMTNNKTKENPYLSPGMLHKVYLSTRASVHLTTYKGNARANKSNGKTVLKHKPMHSHCCSLHGWSTHTAPRWPHVRDTGDQGHTSARDLSSLDHWQANKSVRVLSPVLLQLILPRPRVPPPHTHTTDTPPWRYITPRPQGDGCLHQYE